MRPAAFYHKLVIVQLSANETAKNDKFHGRLPWDWLAVAWLLTATFLSTGRLVATNATENLFSVQWLAAVACIFGLMLGVSSFKGWQAVLLVFIYGLFFIPFQLGIIFGSGQEWPTRLIDLGARLGYALGQFANGQNVTDPLLFLAAMTILFWLLGSHAGFVLNRRGEVWSATIPLGLAALLVHTYDGVVSWRAWLLAGYALCVLMLIARVRLLRQKQIWEQTRVAVPAEINSALSGVVLGAAALIVLLAWATPALASSLSSVESFWSTLTSPWRAFQDQVGRALYPLQGTPVSLSSYFGQRLALGTGIPQSPTTLFTVRVLEQDSVPLRYYWRDRVYDVYENGRWESTLTQEQELMDQDTVLQSVLPESRSTARFAFTAEREIQLLHLAAQPIDLTRAATLLFAKNEDGSLDIGGLFARNEVSPGESYETTAALPPVYSNELREAGTAYPAWVTDRYLQLPADLSERTRQLALTLAEGRENPYDIAVAITDYLRANIEYSNELPDPPADQERIDWMLFEQQQAFCNYYATAEILMLRILGIPARLAVGYSQGEREFANGEAQFRVRQRDAHAWPEVFFPGVGWVEFEPTGNQDPLIRPGLSLSDEPLLEDQQRELRQERTGLAPTEDAPDAKPIAGASASPRPSSGLFGYVVLVTALALLGAAVFWQRKYGFAFSLPSLFEKTLTRFEIPLPEPLQRWKQYNELSALEQAYMQVNVALRRLGSSLKAGQTPRQRTNQLAKRIPELSDELNKLGQAYEARKYSRQPRAGNLNANELSKRIRRSALRSQLSDIWHIVLKWLKLKK